jgi:hypothetical protein
VAQEPSWPLTHALGDGERTLCGLNPFIEKLAATVFPGLVSCEACLLTMTPDVICDAATCTRHPGHRLPWPVSVAVVEERTDQQKDEGVLVDELREEYAQVEADQDRTPTDAGFIEFLARRIARVDAVRAKVRSKAFEEQSGGAAALRDDVVTAAIAELRAEIAEKLPTGPLLIGVEVIERLDRLAALVRGEQQ